MYFIGYRNAEWILEILHDLPVTSQRSQQCLPALPGSCSCGTAICYGMIRAL